MIVIRLTALITALSTMLVETGIPAAGMMIVFRRMFGLVVVIRQVLVEENTRINTNVDLDLVDRRG